jgi:PAS domain S-box-containing protein
VPPRAKRKETAVEKERLQRQLSSRVDELEREREFIRTVVNSTPALFCVLDKDLRVVRYNDALENLSGLVDDASARGQLFHEVFVAPGESADVKRRLLSEDDGVEHESAFRRADGSDAIVAWIKRRVTDSEGRPCIFFSGIDVTARRQEQEQLRASRARIVHAADTARYRIERDLHDGAQQRLVSVSLALRAARRALKNDRVSAAERQLRTIEGELDQALEELRDLARGIHPPILTDRGLEAALGALVVRSPVPVSLAVDVPTRPVPAVETAAYFAVSEALANSIKHAGAARVDIRIAAVDGKLRAEVSDDGRGGADASGRGLHGLRQRLAALDGTLSVSSPEGGPTIVRAELPCES